MRTPDHPSTLSRTAQFSRALLAVSTLVGPLLITGCPPSGPSATVQPDVRERKAVFWGGWAEPVTPSKTLPIDATTAWAWTPKTPTLMVVTARGNTIETVPLNEQERVSQVLRPCEAPRALVLTEWQGQIGRQSVHLLDSHGKLLADAAISKMIPTTPLELSVTPDRHSCRVLISLLPRPAAMQPRIPTYILLDVSTSQLIPPPPPIADSRLIQFTSQGIEHLWCLYKSSRGTSNVLVHGDQAGHWISHPVPIPSPDLRDFLQLETTSRPGTLWLLFRRPARSLSPTLSSLYFSRLYVLRWSSNSYEITQPLGPRPFLQIFLVADTAWALTATPPQSLKTLNSQPAYHSDTLPALLGAVDAAAPKDAALVPVGGPVALERPPHTWIAFSKDGRRVVLQTGSFLRRWRVEKGVLSACGPEFLAHHVDADLFLSRDATFLWLSDRNRTSVWHFATDWNSGALSEQDNPRDFASVGTLLAITGDGTVGAYSTFRNRLHKGRNWIALKYNTGSMIPRSGFEAPPLFLDSVFETDSHGKLLLPTYEGSPPQAADPYVAFTLVRPSLEAYSSSDALTPDAGRHGLLSTKYGEALRLGTPEDFDYTLVVGGVKFLFSSERITASRDPLPTDEASLAVRWHDRSAAGPNGLPTVLRDHFRVEVYRHNELIAYAAPALGETYSGRSALQLLGSPVDWNGSLRLDIVYSLSGDRFRPEFRATLPNVEFSRPRAFSRLERSVLAVVSLNLVVIVLFVGRRTILRRWLPTAGTLLVLAGAWAQQLPLAMNQLRTAALRLQLDPALLTAVLGLEVIVVAALAIRRADTFYKVAEVWPFDSWLPALASAVPAVRERVLAPYFNAVRAQLQIERHDANDEIYVPLPCRVTRGLARDTSEIVADAVSQLQAILEDREGAIVLLEAPGGRGKSALLRRLVEASVDAHEEAVVPANPTTTLRIPIVCDLRGKPMLEQVLQDGDSSPQSGFIASSQLRELLLQAGACLFVVDGLSEQPVDVQTLKKMINSPLGRKNGFLFASRPNDEVRRAISGAQRHAVVEPLGLDRDTIDTFVTAYEKDPARRSARRDAVERTARLHDGTYVPIVARLTIKFGTHGSRGVDDIYYRTLEGLLEKGRSKIDRDRLIELAIDYCVNSYWKSDRPRRTLEFRNALPEDKELLRTLLGAGLIVPSPGSDPGSPLRVRFFHDSMQSYLAARGLARSDDRRKMVFGAAGDPRFGKDRELFAMCLEVFHPKDDLARDLTADLESWVDELGRYLSQADVLCGVPEDIAGILEASIRPDVSASELLRRAIALCQSAADDDVAVKRLGPLYQAMAERVWAVRHASDTNESEGGALGSLA